jgi:xylulokinase
MDYVIGIDLGTSGVKAALMGADGRIADIRSAQYSPEFGAEGYVEQDPKVWADSTMDVLGQLTAANRDKSPNIKALAVSGQMHSSVFLDADGNVVRKAMLWNDTRTGKQVRDIVGAAGGLDGLLGYVSNAAFPGFTLPKVLWLKENEPDNYARVVKVIMPKDYINYRLTGAVKTDVSDAAGTLAYDVVNNKWSDGLLRAVGVSGSLWADAVPSAGYVGDVTDEMAAKLGLPKGVKVYGGGADNCCAAVGTGVLEPGQAAVSVGTSGTVIAYLDSVDPGKIKQTFGAVHIFNYAPTGSYYAMGCMLSAGECLNWLKRGLFPDLTFDEMNELAAATPAGSNGLTFLPYLFGERCPHNDENARGVFFGISGTTGRGEFARAVMEGVAFGLRDMFAMVKGFTPINEIIITGGGAKSPLWAGIIADVLDTPLYVSDVAEAPAMGAAAIAAVGCGIYGNFGDFATKLGKREVITPNPANKKVYAERYGLYKKLYEANKDFFATDYTDLHG